MKRVNVKDILIPTVSLFLICLVITAVLSVTNAVTADKIAQNEAASKEQSMMAVCPDAVKFDEVVPDVVYQGLDASGNPVGYAISSSANGYGGQIRVMTGIKDGVIIGVDVFYNDDETPGLGKNTSNKSFQEQYKGLTVNEDIVVSKDSVSDNAQSVDAVTSATISSRAVTVAVNDACAIYTEIVGDGSTANDADAEASAAEKEAE